MLVSIVIPCHNAAQWLRRSVGSAMAQTGVEIEVIAVENGSVDATLSILQEFGGRIQLIVMPSGAGNVARNAGLAQAQGEWVQFLDADDELQPDKIATQLAEAGDRCGKADVLYSPVLVERWRDGTAAPREPTLIDPSYDDCQRWFAWQLPQTGGVLWRASSLRGLGGWKTDQPCCQEHELYARALKERLMFQSTSTPGAIYRIWSEKTLCRQNPRQVIEVKTLLIQEMAAWLKAKGLWHEKHRRVAGQACFEMARTLASYDLRAAAAYHQQLKREGLIYPVGPAAPRAYMTLYRAAGFSVAERTASWLRFKGKDQDCLAQQL